MGAMLPGRLRLAGWMGSLEHGPGEGREAAGVSTAGGECSHLQLSVFPGLVSRGRAAAGRALWCSWVGFQGALPLGRASPGVESRCQGPVSEHGAGEALLGAEAQQGPAGAGPRERTASCPQAACPPPCHRPVPASPSHGIITSASRLHMQAACMASPLHSPALADHEPAPRPGSCGFSSQHLLGISARVEQGEGTGCAGRSRGRRRHFPGLLPGWGLRPLTRGCFRLTTTPCDGNGALSLPRPCPAQSPAPCHPGCRTRRHPRPSLGVGGPGEPQAPAPSVPEQAPAPPSPERGW